MAPDAVYSTAQARPWATRAAISKPGPWACPATTEASPNTARPMHSTRLRPCRSANRPTTTMKLDMANRKPLITHCRVLTGTSSWPCSAGNAVLTMVKSTHPRKLAMLTPASAHHLR